MKRALDRRLREIGHARVAVDAPSADDAAAFRAAMGDTQPLATSPRVAVVRSPAKSTAVAAPRAPEDVDAAPNLAGMGSVPAEGPATFVRPGQSGQVVRRLRRGYWPLARELDLHGARRDEARVAIASCIQEAMARGGRCVRIVHGRGLRSPGGEPVLRDVTRQWLASCPDVLAFCEAPPAQGGTGALLVLLRRA